MDDRKNIISQKMTIKEKCSKCDGNGWILEWCPPDEYNWEQRECPNCGGVGYFEIEVDEKTGMPK